MTDARGAYTPGATAYHMHYAGLLCNQPLRRLRRYLQGAVHSVASHSDWACVVHAVAYSDLFTRASGVPVVGGKTRQQQQQQ